MATPVAEVVKINWKQTLPWVTIGRALGLALHVRQVFVGIVGAGLIAAMYQLVLNSPSPSLRYSGSDFPDNPLMWIWLPLTDLGWQLMPFSYNGPITWVGTLQTIAVFAWVLVVGGLTGGILCRRAAFEFAREETLSLTTAVRFVIPRTLDYISAPALPLCVVMGVGLMLVLTSWIGMQWTLMTPVLDALWGFTYLGGFVMAILLAMVLAGWPMMVSAISINGGDGFDGLSRGFGFVIDRWRYYAWCATVMTFFGVGGVYLIYAIAHWAWFLLKWSFALGNDAPRLIGPNQTWQFSLKLLLIGLAYSYFWSAMTIIHLVLRKSVDNAELHEIYLDEDATQIGKNVSGMSSPPATGPTLLPIIDPPPPA